MSQSLNALLKAYRKGLGVTQEEAAKLFRGTREWWNRIENGKAPIPRGAIERLDAAVQSGQVNALRRQRVKQAQRQAAMRPVLPDPAALGLLSPSLASEDPRTVLARLLARPDLTHDMRKELATIGLLLGGMHKPDVAEAVAFDPPTPASGEEAAAMVRQIIDKTQEADADGSMMTSLIAEIETDIGGADAMEVRPFDPGAAARTKRMKSVNDERDRREAWDEWREARRWPVVGGRLYLHKPPAGVADLETANRAVLLNVEIQPLATLAARLDEAEQRWKPIAEKRWARETIDDWEPPPKGFLFWSVSAMALGNACVYLDETVFDIPVNELPAHLWPWADVPLGEATSHEGLQRVARKGGTTLSETLLELERFNQALKEISDVEDFDEEE